MDKTTNLIVKAKQLLSTNPYDAGHDLVHAAGVWATAQDLVHHTHKPVKLDVLKIACYWHDVLLEDIDRTAFKYRKDQVNKTADYLKNLMIKYNFDRDTISLTTEAVRLHEFDLTPTSVEGQLVWDADKLEAVNADRLINVLTAAVSGSISPEKIAEYMEGGKTFLSKMQPKLHFTYSRHLFNQRLTTLIERLRSDPEISSLCNQLHLNPEQLVAGIQPK